MVFWGVLGLLPACSGDGFVAASPAMLGQSDGDDDAEDSNGAWPPPPPPTTGADATGDDGFGDEGEGETGLVPELPPDLGACSNDADCMFEGEDDTCWATQGTCEFGQCFFEPLPGGSLCSDGDGCTKDDVCNGMGVCLGVPRDCPVDHGEGTCSDSSCGGPIVCEAGWADCDGNPNNGCEASLDTRANCGGCGEVCSALGPHVETASCVGGTCERTCEGDWEDCNGDAGDGCEIPTGVPNQCDADGLNPDDGCWTAHCGNSNHPDARNFGTWFCFECTTCSLDGDGACQWCSHDSGRWYPANSCDCADDPNDCQCVVDGVDYLELVCAP
ncbi:MAG: hypothetical protein AAGA54_17215 [Myxococcota bacterium]